MVSECPFEEHLVNYLCKYLGDAFRHHMGWLFGQLIHLTFDAIVVEHRQISEVAATEHPSMNSYAASASFYKADCPPIHGDSSSDLPLSTVRKKVSMHPVSKNRCCASFARQDTALVFDFYAQEHSFVDATPRSDTDEDSALLLLEDTIGS
jgi:hypothetical protein